MYRPKLSRSNCVSTPDRWYAVQVQTARQHVAIHNLERQGYSIFAPSICRLVDRRGTSVEVLEPLFPGYVFARFDLDGSRWRSINGTLGVQRLVSFGERPQALPIGFVESLMNSLDERGAVSFSNPLEVGERVRVIGGVFDDLVGTLAAARSQDRVIVMLGLLGAEAPVEMETERLVRA